MKKVTLLLLAILCVWLLVYPPKKAVSQAVLPIKVMPETQQDSIIYFYEKDIKTSIDSSKHKVEVAKENNKKTSKNIKFIKNNFYLHCSKWYKLLVFYS